MTSRPSRTGRLLRNFLAVGAGNYGAMAINFAITAVLTRRLDVALWGRYGLLFTASSVLAALTINWTQGALVRFGSVEHDAKGAIANAFWTRVWIVMPWAFGVLGVPGLWDHVIGVAADATGSAVIVDYPARRILRVDRTGRTQQLWRSEGVGNWLTGGRWGWRPTGVAMLQSSFYVMEDWALPGLVADLVGSPRILLVRPDGSSETVVAVSSLVLRALSALIVVIAFSWLRPRAQRRTVSWKGARES